MLRLRYLVSIILILVPIFGWMAWNDMVPMIGGILLIFGSLFVFTGQIFYSVFVYFLADLAWVAMAYQKGDTAGTIMISIGMALGFAAWLKMNYGKMRKTLEW